MMPVELEHRMSKAERCAVEVTSALSEIMLYIKSHRESDQARARRNVATQLAEMLVGTKELKIFREILEETERKAKKLDALEK